MDDPVPYFQVPGELHVEVTNPYQRFGSALQIYIRGLDGNLYHCRPGEDGELYAFRIDRASYPERPTIFLATDELAVKMRDALTENRWHTRGEESISHLKDVVSQRDSLFDELSTRNQQHHELAVHLAELAKGQLSAKT